jgi:two-component system CheB/CheR fusion protein
MLQKRAMFVPIVGIGASAGGLESIFELIAGIPASTGMAFVFVQHLDPRHGSQLAKILFKRTAFPVEEAREGLKIFPDHLYVIIPDTTLTITDDVLHLRSRNPAERPHRPVDSLFLSLAQKRRPMSLELSSLGVGRTEQKVSKQSKRVVGTLSRRKKILLPFLECRAAPSRRDA